MSAKRSKSPRQADFSVLSGDFPTPQPVTCEACQRWDVKVIASASCAKCGDIHYMSGHSQTVSEADLSIMLDRLCVLMKAYAKMREGGTETETANGGEGYLDDPRSDDDMQLQYAAEEE